MKFPSIPRPPSGNRHRSFPWALAALALSAMAAVACSGNDTGSGGSGGGTTGPTGCDACGPNQVCVEDTCQSVSHNCPCGVETYCDVPTDTCIVGCLSQADCGPGRVCNVETKACFDGCLSTDECRSGLSCVEHQCLEGCGTTADCTVPGTICSDGHCGCPAGQGFCDGTCASLASPSNCGACGVQCQAPSTCNGSECVCAPGVCAPEVLLAPGAGNASSLHVDTTHLYFYSTMGPGGAGIFRLPKGGGAASLVTAKGTPNFTLGGAFVLYTVLTNGNTWAYDLMKAPLAGGADVKLDAGPNATPYAIADAGAAYWYRSDAWYGVPLANGASNVLPAVWEEQPTGGMVINDDGLFWVSCSGGADLNCGVYRYFDGATTQLNQTGFDGFADITTGLVVDAQDAYVGVFSPEHAIVRFPLSAGPPTTVVTPTGVPRQLQGDGSDLYWTEDGNPFQDIPAVIKRVPKGGGAIEDFAVLAPADVVTSIALTSDSVYWTQVDGAILRLAK